MSLLMDALKQAEHAKRDKQADNTPLETPAAQLPVEDTAADLTELSLSPVETGAPVEPASAVAPAAAKTTATLQLAPAPSSEPQPEPVVTPEQPAKLHASEPLQVCSVEPPKQDHHNAQAAARILAASAARHAAQRRRNMIGLIGLAGILVIALGSYYYYASLSQSTPYLGMAQAPATQAEPGLAEPEAAPPTATTNQIAQLNSPPPTQTLWQDGLPPIAPEPTQDWEPAPVDPRVVRGEQPLAFAESDATAAAATPAASIRITRGTQPNKVSLDLQTAYADFQAGRLAQAETGYRQVLARDADNRDARMGLAAIALHSGLLDAARAQYQAVLHRNPRDLTAHAALADLGRDRNANTESQLKSLLAEQPQSAPLHFALANLYAEQQRWPYAQQAYFEAQRLAPEHPDYAFNLAVSLEHLGQSKLALEYYRRAVQLAGSHNAQFDLRAAQQRVSALSLQAQS